MHRSIRRALAPLPLLAILAVGCSQDDVDKAVTSSGGPGPRQSAQGRQALGVFMGGGDAQEIQQFERFVGSDVTHVGAFVSKKSWAQFRQLSWLAEWKNSGYTLSLGVPMLTNTDGGSLAQGAQGAYDDHFRHLAQQLVANGQGNAILRLGWEFNGGWYPWKASGDPKSFAAYWRRIHGVIRSVPGAEGIRFDWNPGIGPASIPEGTYPGDEYVDIIGLDVYDRAKSVADADPAKRWQRMVNQPYGLAWLRDFAAAHGKPMSFPEWATSARQQGGAKSDNPLFIRNMHDWIRSNNVEYHLYFEFDAVDEKGAQLTDGGNPRAASIFQQLF
jgi:hypothetical protein